MKELDFIEFRISYVIFWYKIFCLLWQTGNFETLGVSITKCNMHDI